MYHIMQRDTVWVELKTTKPREAFIALGAPVSHVKIPLSDKDGITLSLDQALALSRALNVMFLEIALTSASQQTDVFSVSVPVGTVFPGD